MYKCFRKLVIFCAVSVFILSLSKFPITHSQSTCALKAKGDADCNGTVNLTDFSKFVSELRDFYLGNLSIDKATANFNGDSSLDLSDFQNFLTGYREALSLSPTPTISLTPILSTTSTPTPTLSITITSSVTTTPGVAKKGIWISQEELLKLPMSGATWDEMKKVADSDIGQANMSEQNSPHSERLVALSLVAARTQNQAYITKAVNEMIEVIGTENNPDADCASSKFGARGLAVGRNLIGYVVSADVLNVRSGGLDPDGKGTKMQQWIDSIRKRKNCDNNGAAAYTNDICIGSENSTSNGNSLSAASCIAAAAYLNDKTQLERSWLTFRKYAGDSSVEPNFQPNSYSANWKATNSPNYVGINPKGAKCTGASSNYPADGVLPNDQGRGGNCPTDPSKAPTYGTGFQYPWEGMQGVYAQALLLDRLGYKDPKGLSPWHVSDDALLRAVKYQCFLTTLPPNDQSWYDSTRAAWVKHLAYKAYGYRCESTPGKPIIPASSGGGRNMDWTQWTHQ